MAQTTTLEPDEAHIFAEAMVERARLIETLNALGIGVDRFSPIGNEECASRIAAHIERGVRG
jgi:hypothetical protein